MARKPALAVVGAACTIYGIAATACSGGHAHFLVASVMPGALLLVPAARGAAAPRAPTQLMSATTPTLIAT